MAITGAIVAGGASMAGGLFGPGGVFGGKTDTQNVQLPQQFQMPNQGAAANAAFQGIQNLPGQNLGQWSTPLAQQTGQNLYNNPYAGGYQQGAGVAGALGQQGAMGQFGAGGALGMAGLGQIPYAGAIEQTAFDPQSALYARTLGQVTDQTRAGLEARGIDNTPYGAGVEGQTLGNFNIDWQNAQLGRQQTGIQGAQQALGAAGGAIGQGAGLQAGAPGQYLTASAMPYSTYSGIGQGQLGALTGAQGVASGAQGLAQQPIQDYLAYLNQGAQFGQLQNQGAALALNQANMGWQQQQQQAANVGKGFGQLAGGLGGFGGFQNSGFGVGAPPIGY